MKLITCAQAREIDRATIREFAVPGLLLMENAGRELALEAFRGTNFIYSVVCGRGNNGGDGFVAARHLKSMGADVVIMLIYPYEKLRGDAKKAFDMALGFGVPVIEGQCFEGDYRLKHSDVIIDAILGIGSTGAPYGEAKEYIKKINEADTTVVSADCPSGVDCDSGQVLGECVNAATTVAFGFAKPGLFLYPGRANAGEVKVVNICFAPNAYNRMKLDIKLSDKLSFPKIKDDDHKGKRGKTLVVAGSEKYSGAAYMAALSALKAGSGIVNLLTPGLKYQKGSPEIIYENAESKDGFFSSEAADKISDIAKGYDAVVAGCGMCVTAGTKKTIQRLITDCKKTLVLDADGINCIATNKLLLKKDHCDIIITPHVGEMAKFLGIAPTEVMENPIRIAKKTAAEYNITVVLKSASTVIAAPWGETYINTLGTSGMATAGSGDVLAGIIGGFAAQGMNAFDAAINGVAAHATAGMMADKAKGKHYMSATDIIDKLSLIETKGCDK